LVSIVAALIRLRGIQLWQVYVLSCSFGLADAFSFPATQSLVPSMVTTEQLPAANSAIMNAAHFSACTAPACAGIAVMFWGITPSHT
jgi:hypothetical protein